MATETDTQTARIGSKRAQLNRERRENANVSRVPEGQMAGGGANLTFDNAIIDKEQLPLYEIVIDWGDDSVQTITDQDYRPNEEQPHIVSHNYIGIDSETEVEIKVLIKDNWGFTRCCRNDDDCSYMQERIPPQCPVRN